MTDQNKDKDPNIGQNRPGQTGSDRKDDTNVRDRENQGGTQGEKQGTTQIPGSQPGSGGTKQNI